MRNHAFFRVRPSFVSIVFRPLIMLASSIVRHRPVRDYSCCVLDSAFCFRDSSLPAPVVMPSRRDFFNPAEAYVMTLGDG